MDQASNWKSAARRLAGKAAADARGGVALPFALTLIPIAFLSVAAVDFNRGTTNRIALQDALDAATLAVGRSQATTASEVQRIGEQTLAINLHLPSGANLTSSEFYLEGSKVKGHARVSVDPIVSDLFTGGKLAVSARSEVQRAVNKLEVALVLDNTGSMSGTKLTKLKEASNTFVDTLAAAAARSVEADAVKIALVPFSTTVKVGDTYRNATWIDQNAASPINNEIFSTAANRFTLLSAMGVSWGGCVEARQAPYDVQETAPTTSTPATLFTPFFAPDEPDSKTKSGDRNANFGTFYNDYLTDEVYSTTNWKTPQNYVGKYDEAPRTGSNTSTGYKYGPNAGCEMAPLIRLTTDTAKVKAGISAMNAVGDTNIPFGLMWGWHALTPNAPFSDGVAYNTPKTSKVVVLMTDGQNQNTATSNSNASYYSGVGYVWQNRLGTTSGDQTTRRNAIDGRLATLCANMKAKGVIIYTVRVEVNDTNYGVLKTCASSPDKFYDVDSASELNSVFKSIAGAIQNLRITR